MSPKPLRILCMTAMLALAGWGAARAAESPWDAWEYGAVRLTGAAQTHGGAQSGAPYAAGLEFKLADGWKVYWRAPGDAGFPPRVDWEQSQNLQGAALRWPAPVRFSVLGLETLGYKNHVVLPIDVTAKDPAAPVVLRGAVEYLACDEICVPVRAELSMTVPPDTADSGVRAGRASAHAQVIARYAARTPDAGTAAGIKIESARVDAYTDGADISVLRVRGRAEPPLSPAADVFFEGPAGLAYGRPELRPAPGGGAASGANAGEGGFELAAEVSGLKYLDAPFIGAALTALVTDGERAAETAFTVALTSADARTGANAPRAIWAVLALAVLGGMILNLMPCVLPVLSVKLMGVIAHGGGEAPRVRRHFLAAAAGVMTVFALLAFALSGLKMAGAAVGWGVQFQQPWFLITMAVLTSVFAANLFGLFEIRLPAAVNRAAANMSAAQPTHAGRAADSGRGLSGDFFTGMFAAVLATPCSAPFVGTAVGFALSRGPGEITAVMLALGLGLAAPYLAVAAAPRAVTMLPKPGPWMVKLRIALGFALLGTAAWLIWVLANVIGPAQPESRTKWAAFDPAAITRAAAEGRVVFVDVTADWCVTCKANKALVLDRGAAAAALAAADVTPMQADWTRPDPAIADYLASFRRYGIPFNAVYGPGAPGGEVLPELLTTDAVLNALTRARGEALSTVIPESRVPTRAGA
ncbi:MAG: protein-disulfide reductase DsbD family protein [Rhodospirillales bacterium]